MSSDFLFSFSLAVARYLQANPKIGWSDLKQTAPTLMPASVPIYGPIQPTNPEDSRGSARDKGNFP